MKVKYHKNNMLYMWVAHRKEMTQTHTCTHIQAHRHVTSPPPPSLTYRMYRNLIRPEVTIVLELFWFHHKRFGWMFQVLIIHAFSLSHTHTRAREPLTFILYRRFNAHQADSMELMPLNEHSDTEKTSKPNRVIRCDVMRCSEENGEIGSEQTSTRQLCMMSCCYLFIYL